MTITEGKLKLDPILNPAVLNTGTWDPETAQKLLASAQTKTLYPESAGSFQGVEYSLAELSDGQTVILAQGEQKGNGAEHLEGALPGYRESDGTRVRPYPATDDNLYRYISAINPHKGPRALGPVQRLGIGVRHSTTLWPGIWQALHKGGFAANAIQNSVRELHLLETLRAGAPPKINHLFSVGPVQEGHSGSSFEGLWTAGVLSDLKSPNYLRYGADADHLQVKRGMTGSNGPRNSFVPPATIPSIPSMFPIFSTTELSTVFGR